MKNLYGYCLILLAGFFLPVFADSIYLFHNNHEGASAALSKLTNLGHTVTAATVALSDYSAYDQVWDLRNNGNFTQSETNALKAFLAQGGRIYFSGENTDYNTVRNDSLLSCISTLGGGTLGGQQQHVNLFDQYFKSSQVMSPNTIASIQFNWGSSYSITGNGFLITETTPGSNRGSIIGWDFGDIEGASSSRMLVSFDMQVFMTNPVNAGKWIENAVTYLGAPAVPEPSTFLLGTISFLGLYSFLTKERRR